MKVSLAATQKKGAWVGNIPSSRWFDDVEKKQEKHFEENP